MNCFWFTLDFSLWQQPPLLKADEQCQGTKESTTNMTFALLALVSLFRFCMSYHRQRAFSHFHSSIPMMMRRTSIARYAILAKRGLFDRYAF